MLPNVMEKAANLHDWWQPELAIAGRGYDSSSNHNWLDEQGITPIIHIREPGEKRYYNGIYTKLGIPICMGMVPMEYAGTNPENGHHLYVCREGGCHLKDSRKGGIVYSDSEVWEDPSDNIMLFGKIRRDSPEWKAHYQKRWAIERVFKTLKESRRLEAHYVQRLRNIRLHALMSTLVFQATSLAHIRAGEQVDMRWMVAKIA